MLRSIKDLLGYPIDATDGRVGKVKDALFDDRHWRLRYIVADTGTWLPKNKVLIGPQHLESPETGWIGNGFPVTLTKAQIEASPELRKDAPVAMQYEEEYAKYYNLPLYWVEPNFYAIGSGTPAVPAHDGEKSEANRQAHEFRMRQIAGNHLRSAHEIIGYRIEAKDCSFGHVEDFIIDDETWRIQYLIIDTKNWLPGKPSLIDIGWVDSFNWNERTARVDLTKKQIEIAPKFDPRDPVNKDEEDRLYDYYGKPRHRDTPAAPLF